MTDPRPRFTFPYGAQVTFNTLYVLVPSLAQTAAADPLDLHTRVAFIYTVLFVFLQLKYLQNPTLFQVHPKTTKLSMAAFIGYILALSGSRFAMRVFGSLSFISLASMVLLDTEPLESLSGFIIYTLWFIVQMVPFIITRFKDIWNWVQVQRGQQPPPLLPITIDLNQLQLELHPSVETADQVA